MTVKELFKLKKGDEIYVPIINNIYEYEIGDRIYKCHLYRKYKLKIKDILIFDYDPKGEYKDCKYWFTNRKSVLFKLDTSTLSMDEYHNFLMLYRKCYPCMFNPIGVDGEYELRDKYYNYLEFNISHEVDTLYELGDNKALDIYKFFSTNSKTSDRKIKKLNKISLTNIDESIKYLKKIKNELSELINLQQKDSSLPCGK